MTTLPEPVLDLDIATATATGGTTARTMADRFRDTISALDFGVVGDGSTDDTVKLNAWLAAGGGFLPVPPGGFYKTTVALIASVANTKIIGVGPASLIKLVLPAGSPAVPVIDVQSTAVGTVLDNIAVNGNAAGLTANTVYGGNIIASSAILIQANQVRVSRTTVSNSYDNGIAIVQMTAGGGVVSGQPRDVEVTDIIGLTCSVGTKAGSAIDIGSGIDVVVSNCNDIGSAVGFTLDIGAGANCMFVNCRSWAPTLYDSTHGGYGFYIGGADSALVNCTSAFAPVHGFWIDRPAQNVQLVACQAVNPSGHGFLIKSAANATLLGCVAKNASTGNSNVYNGFMCDSSSGAQTAIQLVGCTSMGTFHAYGYGETGGSGTSTQIVGGSWNGISAAIQPGKATGAVTFGNASKLVVGGGLIQSLTTTMVQQSTNAVIFTAKDSGIGTNTYVIAQGGASGAPPLLIGYSDSIADVSLQLTGKGTGSVIIGDAAHSVGFYNNAGATKQTITGAKAGNAALASLISALAAMGLVGDGTT